MGVEARSVYGILHLLCFYFNSFFQYWKYILVNFFLGGLVVAQALMAAFHTLQDPDWLCHSCHAYFLLPGNVKELINYQVEVIRNGK